MKSIHDPRYVNMINRLIQVRKTIKVSQQDLADRLNIDRTLITKTETFVRRLDFIELCDWLDALEYNVEDFLRDVGRIK